MSSLEKTFTIFMYFENNIAHEFGMVCHEISGSDDEKLKILHQQLEIDVNIAKRFKLKRNYTFEQWTAHKRIGRDDSIFLSGFDYFGYSAMRSPMLSFREVIDGILPPDVITLKGSERLWGNTVSQLMYDTPDWLHRYTKNGLLLLNDLIEDDFFSAIRQLMEAGHNVSSAKLLMLCIDTLSFLEYGDVQHNFTKWLHRFSELSELNITPEEIWEFRNSIVHMTNLSSRKVREGKVVRLSIFNGPVDQPTPQPFSDTKLFNLEKLLAEIIRAVHKWGYSIDTREKFAQFIERYDTLISDVRYGTYPTNETQPSK